MSKRVLGRLAIVAGLLGVLVLATAAPAMPAQPEAADMQLAAQPAWAGHATCGALVDVSLAGDPFDVGGYETKVNFDTAYFGYTSGGIQLTDFLATDRNGASRFTSGDDGTPPLEAIGAGNVKFGDYSWGTQAGANAPGQLATVELDIVQCGTGNVSLSESQVVDYLGTPFWLGTEASLSVPVHALVDVAAPFGLITAADVAAVSARYFQTVDSTCGSANYMLDVAAPFGLITAADVAAVSANYFQQTGCP
jgi:hypothetical protein